MDVQDFTSPAGTLVDAAAPDASRYIAFVPDPLPPAGEPQAVASVVALLADADNALGTLDGVVGFLPNPELLIRQYKRREAVLSSKIEGTRTSFSELVAFEALHESPDGDAREVFNYLVALDHGLRNVPDGITRDLLTTMHRQLMSGGRGEAFSTPGAVRSVQNHLGAPGARLADASFVPPPPEAMQDALDALLGYVAERHANTPTLVEAAWMHYQFETIHPFLDGNGRLGRVLIPLLLAARKRLTHPVLYLSPYFERNRAEYYRRLFAVSTTSDWGGWLRFFLAGVLEQAQADTRLARSIVNLGVDWHERLSSAKASHTSHRLADLVHQVVALDARTVERELNVAPQTASNTIERLRETGILAPYGDRRWRRLFYARELSDLLQDNR